jgi:hypothetical protein
MLSPACLFSWVIPSLIITLLEPNLSVAQSPRIGRRNIKPNFNIIIILVFSPFAVIPHIYGGGMISALQTNNCNKKQAVCENSEARSQESEWRIETLSKGSDAVYSGF